MFGQRDVAGAAEAKLALKRLQVLGTVLMIAAHPDDENTAVLAYFARGRHMDSAYLSLTRGEGGQNLIGPELGDKLGVIRTHELLAARRVDGAQQYFTRAIDFGFTKTPEEALQKWGREAVLADTVWVIRKLRPDVIILRFSGTPRDGHGQHQASAMVGKEAFAAAADPKRFPEQLKWVEPWQAKRVVWNIFAFNPEQEREAAKMGGRVSVDAGEYNPVLGYGYGEIAGMSRSMHRSQGMGSAERRGSMTQHFINVAGEAASGDVFDGIDTTWGRVPGGAQIGAALAEAEREFVAEQPERAIPALVKARGLMAGRRDPWSVRKLKELDETMALCAGVWVDAAMDRPTATPGAQVTITATALNRSRARVRFEKLTWAGTAVVKPEAASSGAALEYNQPATRKAAWTVSREQPFTQPYWLLNGRTGESYAVGSQELIGLAENPPLLEAEFAMDIEGAAVVLRRPVAHRYVDRERGERVRPIAVVPPVSIAMPENAVVLPHGGARPVEIPVRSNAGPQKGALTVTAADGWRVEPARAEFALGAGEQKVLTFTVTAPASDSRTVLKAEAAVDGMAIHSGMEVLNYPHIPQIALFPAAATRAVGTAVRTLATNIGYVMGAGDEVPASLQQIGCAVTMLTPADLAVADLSRFDAIVTGVRAWNVRADLRANRQRLFDYARNGGTVVVQYNVLEGGFGGGDPRSLDMIGPHRIRVSRERVSVEDAPVTFPNPDHPLLRSPNRISAADFEGWVQERGLYFASEWDAQYQPLFESHDPGEKPLAGGTLVARYGKGAYVFTAYSWFRQLPAGVPGAYRIFANLLSAGKVLADER